MIFNHGVLVRAVLLKDLKFPIICYMGGWIMMVSLMLYNSPAVSYNIISQSEVAPQHHIMPKCLYEDVEGKKSHDMIL